MSAYYFDASVFVKVYLSERGTSWVRDVLGTDARIGFAAIGYAETVMALRHAKEEGRLPETEYLERLKDLNIDWHAIVEIIAVGDNLHSQVHRLAMDLERTGKLRALDAIHVAAALTMDTDPDTVTFVSCDDRQKKAAELYFRVFDPEEHDQGTAAHS